MNKLNELKNLYKNNRRLFDIIVFMVNATLIAWQAIFTLILPSRINIIILLVLIGSLVYQLIKDSWFY